MTERLEHMASIRPNVAPGREAVSPAWILAVLLRDRRMILGLTGVGFVLALLVALVRASYYTSTFSFIPQAGQDQSRSGLASLAGQLGIAVGGSSQPPQLYADLLLARVVLAPIAHDSFQVRASDTRRVPLAEFLGTAGSDTGVAQEMTLRALREKVISASAATRTTGVVSVNVRTRSPQVSLGIAQRLLEGLNKFNVATRKSQAGEERRFTEGRLTAAQASLRAAEDALQNFLQANRQFTNAPQLSFQRDRLQREVTLQQQVVIGLAQQTEDARIREVRDTPVITVIERPTLPVLPDPRGRATTVILGTMIAFVIGAGLSLVREGWNRQRDAVPDSSYALLAREWQGLRRMFRKS